MWASNELGGGGAEEAGPVCCAVLVLAPPDVPVDGGCLAHVATLLRARAACCEPEIRTCPLVAVCWEGGQSVRRARPGVCDV
jgi:hypothetical protein